MADDPNISNEQKFTPIRADVVARGIAHAEDDQLKILMSSPEVANHPEIGPALVAELKKRMLYRTSPSEQAPAVTDSEPEGGESPSEAPEVDVLTAEKIKNSETLIRANALPGDEVINNKLVRKFSKPIKREIITEEMLEGNLRLQQLGAKPGDVLEGKTLIKADSESAFKQFVAMADKATGDIGHLRDTIWANFTDDIVSLLDFNKDLKEWVTTKAEEKWGQGFVDATPEERREAIFLQKEREMMETYGSTFEERPDTPAGMAGSIAGSLMTPTTAIPFGGGVKGALAIGAALGVSQSALDDYATQGEIDPKKALLTGALTAAVPGATAAIGKKLVQRTSAKVVDRVQKVVNEHMKTPAAVVTSHTIPRLAREAGVSQDVFTKALSNIGMKADDLVQAATENNAIKHAVVDDSTVSRFYSKALDKYLGTLSTHVGNISEEIKFKLRRFEFNAMNKTKEYTRVVAPFSRSLKRLPAPVHREVSRHLNNGNFSEARGIMSNHSASMADEFDKVVDVLTDLKKQLTSPEVGFNFDSVDNYFPRAVKDYDGLQQSFGKEQQGIIDRVWAAQRKKLGRELTEQEKVGLVNSAVRGYNSNFDTPLPSIVKRRTIDRVDDNQMDFYASPEEALSMYIRKAVNHIERRKFFGKGAVFDDTSGLDVDQSIGAFITDGVKRGAIKAADQDKLKELLTARFVTGETPTGKFLSVIRDTGYMGTITNPMSALTQLGDVATIAALKGLKNTFVSFLGPKAVKMADVMDDQISREFANPGVTSRALEKMFRVSGFKAMDRLGKETALNASLKHNQNLLLSAKGRAKFDNKWRKVFGEELGAVKSDLNNGEMSENVKFLLFNELSDMQPISLSEMPLGYLQSPNGRIMYMLKSFSLKQIDVVRNNIVKEWKKGSKGTAVKNAVLLGSYLSMANLGVSTVKDILQGRDTIEVDDIPNEALWTLLGVYGLSKYTAEKYVDRGDVRGAVFNTLMPPLPVAEAAAKGTIGLAKGTEESNQLLKLVPVAGNLLYNFLGGGMEKANERTRKEKYAND